MRETKNRKTMDDRLNELFDKAQALEELQNEREACLSTLRVISGLRYEDDDEVEDYSGINEDPWGDCPSKEYLEDSYVVVFSGNCVLRIMRGTIGSQLMKQAVSAELQRIEDLMDEIMKEEI